VVSRRAGAEERLHAELCSPATSQAMVASLCCPRAGQVAPGRGFSNDSPSSVSAASIQARCLPARSCADGRGGLVHSRHAFMASVRRRSAGPPSAASRTRRVLDRAPRQLRHRPAKRSAAPARARRRRARGSHQDAGVAVPHRGGRPPTAPRPPGAAGLSLERDQPNDFRVRRHEHHRSARYQSASSRWGTAVPGRPDRRCPSRAQRVEPSGRPPGALGRRRRPPPAVRQRRGDPQQLGRARSTMSGPSAAGSGPRNQHTSRRGQPDRPLAAARDPRNRAKSTPGTF